MRVRACGVDWRCDGQSPYGEAAEVDRVCVSLCVGCAALAWVNGRMYTSNGNTANVIEAGVSWGMSYQCEEEIGGGWVRANGSSRSVRFGHSGTTPRHHRHYVCMGECVREYSLFVLSIA